MRSKDSNEEGLFFKTPVEETSLADFKTPKEEASQSEIIQFFNNCLINQKLFHNLSQENCIEKIKQMGLTDILIWVDRYENLLLTCQLRQSDAERSIQQMRLKYSSEKSYSDKLSFLNKEPRVSSLTSDHPNFDLSGLRKIILLASELIPKFTQCISLLEQVAGDKLFRVPYASL